MSEERETLKIDPASPADPAGPLAVNGLYGGDLYCGLDNFDYFNPRDRSERRGD